MIELTGKKEYKEMFTPEEKQEADDMLTHCFKAMGSSTGFKKELFFHSVQYNRINRNLEKVEDAVLHLRHATIDLSKNISKLAKAIDKKLK